MKRPLALTLPIVLLTALSLGSEPTSAATQTCANTYGGDVISAKNVGCKKARRVVRSWAHGYKDDGEATRSALGFDCRGVNDSVEGLVIKCRQSDKRVNFYANVP